MAHKYPQRYQLIFGTPIPGYQAPIMEVMPTSARSLGALVSVVEQLRLAGKLKIKSFPRSKQKFKVGFEMWKKYGGEVDVLSLSVAMVILGARSCIGLSRNRRQLTALRRQRRWLYLYEMNSITQQFIKE